MLKSLLLCFAIFTCSIANSQLHFKIKNDNGQLVKCDSVTFVDSQGKKIHNRKCKSEVGCCVLSGNCDDTAELWIFPDDRYLYFTKNIRSCRGGECKISYKQTAFNMQEASRSYVKKGNKKEALLYNKTLTYEFKRNDNANLALAYEKQSYLILGQLLLNDNSDSLVKIENNDIFVDPTLRDAIKKYQVSNNLTTQNGQFTEEVAQSLQVNKNLFLKDKVFTGKGPADGNIEFKSPDLK